MDKGIDGRTSSFPSLSCGGLLGFLYQFLIYHEVLSLG